jgi:lipid II isoglutaminyl synthase (glutamine-hydrolysing)
MTGDHTANDSTVDIGLVLPDLLGTYGDGGNAEILVRRLRWRGIPARIIPIPVGRPMPLSLPVYVVGGGEDAAQELAISHLAGLAAVVERGAVTFTVCAGLQLLGRRFTGSDGRTRAGLGLLDVCTRPTPRRAVGEIVAEPCVSGLDQPLTGFENHQGHTTLGPYAAPLARVVRGVGNGDGTEGVVQGAIVGTYLHGPALARNPQLADLLLTRVLGRPLPPLDVPAVAALRQHRLDAVLGTRTGHRA